MVINHFLIGPPGAGKSTFAKHLIQLYPTAQIVSTDAIRARLFGDESIQGNWPLVERNVLSQMREISAAGRPVIYDATNAKLEWRLSILKQIANDNMQWIGWYLTTPLPLCQTWNHQRSRQVPEIVIEESFQSLQRNPPSVAEGFVAVISVAVTPKGFNFSPGS